MGTSILAQRWFHTYIINILLLLYYKAPTSSARASVERTGLRTLGRTWPAAILSPKLPETPETQTLDF